MIIECFAPPLNAYLGHFAFRRLRNNTAPSLLNLMDAKAIDRAFVSSAAAITYRNPQSGNEAFAEQVKPHRDRFTPFAVVNQDTPAGGMT